jgi:hypothetical protein
MQHASKKVDASSCMLQAPQHNSGKSCAHAKNEPASDERSSDTQHGDITFA